MVTIYSEPTDVSRFVDEIIKEADQEKRALGFLPDSVYAELADQGKLVVAARADAYVGHLLYGGVFPHARIFQLHVKKRLRNAGIGRELVDHLICSAEKWNYLSVTARVAEDLEANSFWQWMGFNKVRTLAGGASRNRKINVRVRELNTPRLFPDATIIRPSTDLRLVERLSTRTPQYVIDLNVMFDVLKKRINTDDARKIITAGFKNLIRLAVTGEFIEELKRNATQKDPVLEFAMQLPILAQPVEKDIAPVLEILEAKIFPQRAAEGRLTVQDRSDVIHLATAIAWKASGFVTGEKAILNSRAFLRDNYGLDVIGVNEMAALADNSSETESSRVYVGGGQELLARPTTGEDAEMISGWLARLGVPSQLGSDLVNSLRTKRGEQMLLLSSDTPVAVGCWIPESPDFCQAFVCADEESPYLETGLDRLLDTIARKTSRHNPVMIRLRLLPGHVRTQSVALAHGFRTGVGNPESAASLQKLAVGRSIRSYEWDLFRSQVNKSAGLELPARMPDFETYMQPISIKVSAEESFTVSLRDLETLLSPILLLLPGRSGAIAPIRPKFAADLFDNSDQLQLLGSPEASFLRERVYFSDPRTCPILKKGKPILFYESGRDRGRASVIAAARVVRTDLISKEAVVKGILNKGVLSEDKLRRMGRSPFLAATTIDNIINFRYPVSLTALRALGFNDPTNLVTTKEISDQLLSSIIQKGESRE